MESSCQKGDGFTISISPPIPLSLLSENEKNEKSPPPDQIKGPTPGNLESQIGRCFAGKSVFLTGVTGYVTDLKKYVLTKEQRQESEEEAQKKLLRLYMISRGVQIFGIILLFLVVGRLIAISITGF